MAASGGTLTWSTTSVTLAVGETITVNYTTTFSDVQSANFAPLIASVATFTPPSAKEQKNIRSAIALLYFFTLIEIVRVIRATPQNHSINGVFS